jgi:XTP/dITP diphosphohydrolase
MQLTQVVLASGNPGKLAEMQALLAPAGVELLPQSALGIGDADEPFGTFIENALAKARHASASSGMPAVADDSGICVPSLGGAPGVLSARYAGAAPGTSRSQADAANNRKLIDALAGRDPDARTSYYYCALVLVRAPDDPQPVVADGLWHGTVIDDARGTGGFGYDAHFLLPDLGLTAAQLSSADKNRVSHRAIAMRALIDKLAQARLLERVSR